MAYTLLLLIGIFVVALSVRRVSGLNLCAMCVAVGGGWLILLILREVGYAIDPVILSMLLGGSVVGLTYYLFAKEKVSQLFKFPFLLILFWLAYYIGQGFLPPSLDGVLVLVAIWVIFGLIYEFNKHDKLKKIGQQIIECCRNW